MAEHFYIRVNGKDVPVSKEVYQFHKSSIRKLRTLHEKDLRNQVVSYHAMATETVAGEEMVYERTTETTEDVAFENILIEQLRQGINKLPQKEREVINAIYYQGLSERQFSKRSGVPQMTINCRKLKAIARLKKFLEK